MALRLAGEELSVVQGLDSLGWLREVIVNSTNPALKVKQQGSGNMLELWEGSSQRVVFGSDAVLKPSGRIDAQKGIYNSSANNSGRVYVDDEAEIAQALYLRSSYGVVLSSESVTGNGWAGIPVTNGVGEAVSTGMVERLDTSTEGQVVALGGAGNDDHSVVITTGAGAGATVRVPLVGVVLVNVDTGAVAIGDILVASTVSHRAMVNNAQTDPKKIIGVALSSKSAGSNGQVRAWIGKL